MFVISDIVDMGNAHERILCAYKELPPRSDDDQEYTLSAQEDFDE